MNHGTQVHTCTGVSFIHSIFLGVSRINIAWDVSFSFPLAFQSRRNIHSHAQKFSLVLLRFTDPQTGQRTLATHASLSAEPIFPDYLLLGLLHTIPRGRAHLLRNQTFLLSNRWKRLTQIIRIEFWVCNRFVTTTRRMNVYGNMGPGAFRSR